MNRYHHKPRVTVERFRYVDGDTRIGGAMYVVHHANKRLVFGNFPAAISYANKLGTQR